MKNLKDYINQDLKEMFESRGICEFVSFEKNVLTIKLIGDLCGDCIAKVIKAQREDVQEIVKIRIERMKITINKKPLFENDSYLFTIKDFIYDINKIKDPYILLKLEKFKNKDITKDDFKPFLEERGSLRFFDLLPSLDGSIYTHSVEQRNSLTYQQVLQSVRNIFSNNRSSRKAVVRIANSIGEYEESEKGKLDVSCLSMIHYLNDKVVFVFRSSDIQYELFADIITLYEYFIKPIYDDKKIDIEIFGSTGQNVDYFNTLIDNLKEM